MFPQWNILYSVIITKMSFLSMLPKLNANFKNWKTRHLVDSSLFVSYFWAKKKKCLRNYFWKESDFSITLVV